MEINNNQTGQVLQSALNNTKGSASEKPVQAEQKSPAVQFELAPYSSLLKSYVLAQGSKILASNALNTTQGYNAQAVGAVNEASSDIRHSWKNNLMGLFRNNEATILGVIPRTMNAKDTDGNALIQEGEMSGNFISDVERLDEIKAMGINTLHMLPINPPGKMEAMGTAGSIYAPEDLLKIDPQLKDPNDPRSVEEQCKYFIDECHKRGINVMLDLPSCTSLDFAKQHPEMMAKEKDGEDKTPQGWRDIRMFSPWEDEENKVLNKEVLDLHKRFVDMCVDLGVDGIRADVGRAKPVEFWNTIIPYSRVKDPNFGWLAETYTYEDASPQVNMPHDRPEQLLKAGFDTYYGQFHIFDQWTKADDLYKYMEENIDMSNRMEDAPRSFIGSFATHDDVSPMLYGGAPWVMLTSAIQSTLPMVNPYFIDGVQSGDYYLYPYEGATSPSTKTDNHECTVHKGRIDIFNLSRKPGGDHPEIGEFMKKALELKNDRYKDVINKGSMSILETGNPEIIAYARTYNGKTLLTVANRNVNERNSGVLNIPSLSENESLMNLVPMYGEKSYLQKQGNGKIALDLGPSRAHIFEINAPNIEAAAKKVLKQEFERPLQATSGNVQS